MTCFTAATALAFATAATQRDFWPSGAMTSTMGILVRTLGIIGKCAPELGGFQIGTLPQASWPSTIVDRVLLSPNGLIQNVERGVNRDRARVAVLCLQRPASGTTAPNGLSARPRAGAVSLGHCEIQIRPLTVKAGQYRTPGAGPGQYHNLEHSASSNENRGRLRDATPVGTAGLRRGQSFRARQDSLTQRATQ
jgi:hypothetical protein